MRSADIRVIGIGASAGGLDALLELLGSLPLCNRTCFIIAQHLARDEHAQLVQSLLRKESCWPVLIPQDACPLSGGQIYLLPALHDGCVSAGTIRLQLPAPESYSCPGVNPLFRSLAAEYGSDAMGIILSGAGSDGAEGARALRQAAATLWVQSPDEARYNSMPLAALQAGKSSLTACIAVLAAELQRRFQSDVALSSDVKPQVARVPLPTYDGLLGSARRPEARPSAENADQSDSERQKQEILQRILAKLDQSSGIHFSGYKEDTLLRRLSKRQAQLAGLLNSVNSETPFATDLAYLTYLEKHPEELAYLEQFFLVSVSSFFRDPEVFRLLEQILQALGAEKRCGSGSTLSDAGPLRILVAGCATGEEAYSIAILCEHLIPDIELDITAVDLSHGAISTARSGRYPCSKLSQIPTDYHRYLMQDNQGGFSIQPEIRHRIRFSQGDLLTLDFPYQVDIVVCRNLMIYLKYTLQEKLLERFFHVLRPEGWLITGLTESLPPKGQYLFFASDHYHRIFRARAITV